MSLTKIRGNVQIRPLSITNSEIATNAEIQLTKIAGGVDLIKKDGSISFTGNINAGNNKIINLLEPSLSTDAATKNYVDNAILSGNLAVPSLKVITGTISATSSIIPAVPGKRLKIQSYALFTESVNTVVVQFKSATNGTTIWTVPLQAIAGTVFGANLSTQYPGFLFATISGQLLEINLSINSAVTYSITYWDQDSI